ncbi:MAG: hypothetical protein LBH13_01445 [Cellulomonadaceae bacterium]|jgi:hypothetical protein|nr:hypothetical protein [Cellulomonadaceae bacterium]
MNKKRVVIVSAVAGALLLTGAGVAGAHVWDTYQRTQAVERSTELAGTVSGKSATLAGLLNEAAELVETVAGRIEDEAVLTALVEVIEATKAGAEYEVKTVSADVDRTTAEGAVDVNYAENARLVTLYSNLRNAMSATQASHNAYLFTAAQASAAASLDALTADMEEGRTVVAANKDGVSDSTTESLEAALTAAEAALADPDESTTDSYGAVTSARIDAQSTIVEAIAALSAEHEAWAEAERARIAAAAQAEAERQAAEQREWLVGFWVTSDDHDGMARAYDIASNGTFISFGMGDGSETGTWTISPSGTVTLNYRHYNEAETPVMFVGTSTSTGHRDGSRLIITYSDGYQVALSPSQW